jgi:type IV pilus assembly protein PilQ
MPRTGNYKIAYFQEYSAMNRQELTTHKKWHTPILGVFALAWLALGACSHSYANQLDHISFTSLPGNAVQINLDFSDSAVQPVHFTTDNPSRLILDFPGVGFNAQRSLDIGMGNVSAVNAVNANNRTRVVVSLLQSTTFSLATEDKRLQLSLGGSASQSVPARNSGSDRSVDSERSAGSDSGGLMRSSLSSSAAPMRTPYDDSPAIAGIDFRRSESGAAQIIANLSDPNIMIDVAERGRKIVVEFKNTALPDKFDRRLDVADFATPVLSIDTTRRGKDVVMEIETTGEQEYLSYQSGSVYTVQVQQVAPKDKATEIPIEERQYSGEKLSLNFQNIDIRAVLHLLADFKNKNLVLPSHVGGRISLRLKNVPWDQAMDIILETNALGLREVGNVWHIDLRTNLDAKRHQELESNKKIKELEPLKTEFIQINYATAEEFASLLKSQAGATGQGHSFLSARGSVAVNSRTNTLLVQDTADKIEEVRKLVMSLDKPVRQVLIAARVVIADDNFVRDLGVRFGHSNNASFGPNREWGTMIGGTTGGARMPIGTGENTAFTDNMIFDLPAANSTVGMGLAIGRIGTYLLQLELSAMETEGRGEVVSSPRVITADQQAAKIEQGIKKQVQGVAGVGATAEPTWVDATLALNVTPRITPDDRILMDLDIKKDEPTMGPDISTRNLKTQVLVNNGETVVLGGVFEQSESENIRRVPFFGELPIVGVLFRNKYNRVSKSELLIFVTPSIMKENTTH